LKIPKSSFAFAAAWLLLITILLCIPGTSLPKVRWDNKVFLDKWIHVFLFLLLVLLWCRAYKTTDSTKAKRIFITITVLSIVYGIVMEIVQHYFIRNRSFDFGDMIADSVGSVAGYFISIKRFLRHR